MHAQFGMNPPELSILADEAAGERAAGLVGPDGISITASMSHPSSNIAHMFATEMESREPDIIEVEAAMADAAGMVNAAEGRLVALVADGLAKGVWQQGGVQSPTHWLTWQLGISTGHARRLLALAHRAPELPATMTAFAGGELSFDQAAVIARHVPAEFEESAADLARLCTVRQLTRALARYSFEAPDPDPDAQPEAPAPEARNVGFGGSDDGRWHLHAGLPADEGAVVEQALTAAHQQLFHAAAGEEHPHVTWADALLAVAESYLAAGEALLPGAGRFVINAHLQADPADPAAPGGLALHLGFPLPSELRRLIECDTTIRPVTLVGGLPVNVGRTMRIVPERTRRLIEQRDGGCAVPGCGATRFLQIHHLDHWENGGPTATWNLVALCPLNHRQHHLGLLQITGNPDLPPDDPGGLRFTDARGRPIGPAAGPRPPTELPDCAPYRHPTGEPLETRWLYLPPNRFD